MKVLYSICQQIWKTQQWPQDWKRSISIPIPKKGNAKKCSNYHTIALISHASKAMLKIVQAQASTLCELRTSRCSSWILKRQRETRDQTANICWIIEKAIKFQKNIYFCFIDYAKAFDYMDCHKLQNSERDGNTTPPYLLPEKSLCRSGSNS